MKMFIDGKRLDAADGKVIEVVNSATQEKLDTVPAATPEDVKKAIDAAQEGKKIWGKMPQYQRSALLVKCAELIDAHAEELAALLSTEMGKVITEARGEVSVAAQIFRGFAERANHLYGDVMPEYQKGSENDIIFTRREPLGVVACITPFNFPVELAAHKIATALAAGNAVIVKPASDNPLTVLRMVELCWEAGIPGNVLQAVTGRGGSVGNILSESDKINAISMTGSTEVGIDISKRAAGTLKRVYLELGGNDPFVVFGDADIDLAVEEAVSGRMQNAGQTCCAPKRFIVHNSVKAEFTQTLINKLNALKRGSPLDPETRVGSLISVKAAEKVQEQVDATIAAGAKCVLGGKAYDGSYFEPTVLTDVTRDMPICGEMEVFGPVYPIIGFDTYEEAVSIANDIPYGLQAGVFTRDINTAIKAASQIECGGVVINGASSYRNTDQPFGGWKMSGIGREGMVNTLNEFTQEKSYILKGVLK